MIAVNAINNSLTIRNWLIGFYIVEYEQNKHDRAAYGEDLVNSLALKLNHMKGVDSRSLFRFRLSYMVYQYLFDEIINESKFLYNIDYENVEKLGSVTPLSENSLNIYCGQVTTSF